VASVEREEGRQKDEDMREGERGRERERERERTALDCLDGDTWASSGGEQTPIMKDVYQSIYTSHLLWSPSFSMM
jgi:hypothetical protein